MRSEIKIEKLSNFDNFIIRYKKIMMGIFLILSSILFYKFFWNRIFAVNVEGWFEYYAFEMNKGKIPYKDFYLFTTPIFPLTLKFIFSIFGNYFYLSHIMGVVTNILCCLFMYSISIEIGADIVLSSIICFTSMCIFSIDTGEPTNYYNHESILFLIISAFFHLRSLKNNTKILLILSGFFASLCFFTKQTIGIVWIFSIGLLLISEVIINKNNDKKTYLSCFLSKSALILSGLCIPATIIFAWLYSHGALYDFFDQTLLRGPSSKGGILVIVSRPIYRIFSDTYVIGFPFFGAFLLSLSLILFLKNKYKTLSYFSIILLCWIFVYSGFNINFVSDRFFNRLLIYTGVCLSIFFIIEFIYKGIFLKDKLQPFNSLALVCCSLMSISTWFALGISYPVFEPMAMTTIAPPFICFLLYSWKNIENKSFIYFSSLFLCSIILYNTCVFKFQHPWAWSDWSEPDIGQSQNKSQLKMLAHLKLPSSTLDIVESTVASVKKYSLSNDDVYMYPFFPSLYMLSYKDAYTFTYSSYIDVAPDYALQRDMDILNKRKPHVIVKLDYPSSWISGLEDSFRGKKTTQSDFYNYITDLSKSYKVVNERRIFSDVWLRVYVEK